MTRGKYKSINEMEREARETGQTLEEVASEQPRRYDGAISDDAAAEHAESLAKSFEMMANDERRPLGDRKLYARRARQHRAHAKEHRERAAESRGIGETTVAPAALDKFARRLSSIIDGTIRGKLNE